MKLPRWYGNLYPSFEQLESYAAELGAEVVTGPISCPFYFPGNLDVDLVPVIGLPEGVTPIKRCWDLAHELGHLVQHSGPKGELFWSKGEAQANRWAAAALIPEARILEYKNACLDTFMAAMARHYGPFPDGNSPERRLAARVAKIRLANLPPRPDDSWDQPFDQNGT